METSNVNPNVLEFCQSVLNRTGNRYVMNSTAAYLDLEGRQRHTALLRTDSYKLLQHDTQSTLLLSQKGVT